MNFIFILACVVAAAPIEGESSSKTQSEGFLSPHDAWEAYRHARHDQRWKDAFRCLTPESQDHSVLMILHAAAYLTRVEQAKGLVSELERVVKRRGIKIEEIDAEAVFQADLLQKAASGIKDKEAFFDEAMSVVEHVTSTKRGKDNRPPMAYGSLNNVVVQNDRAIGEFVQRLDERAVYIRNGVRNTTVVQKVDFRKIRDRWFVDSRGS